MLSLEYVRTFRRMPWIRRGMRVVVNGREAQVTSGGEGGNIRVRFLGAKYSVNVHPQWKTLYYDERGKVIASYAS